MTYLRNIPAACKDESKRGHHPGKVKPLHPLADAGEDRVDICHLIVVVCQTNVKEGRCDTEGE